MHDPMTVAFEIKYPWKYRAKPKNGKDYIETEFDKNYRESFITIWHVDPEKDGSDDSCGWFMRSRHGDKKILEKIEREFEFNWDSMFVSDNKHTYYTGWFKPTGEINMTLQGVVLNMFYRAAFIVFHNNWDKAKKYMQKNLFNILFFADNNMDSLNEGLYRTFENACNEEYTETIRKVWIHKMADIVYGYILRGTRPWYKHPKWHIWHWKIQIHPLQKILRFLFDRCCVCGKRFGYNEYPLSNWEGNHLWHSSCDHTLRVPDDEIEKRRKEVQNIKIMDIPKQGDLF